MTPTDRLALQRLLERLRREQKQRVPTGPTFDLTMEPSDLAREADLLVPVIERILEEKP